MKQKNYLSQIQAEVFFPPAIVVILALGYGLIDQEGFEAASSASLSFLLSNLGWFYMLGASILTVFCLWAGYSRYGEVKLGGEKAEPEISTFMWWALSICAGIAVGIVYYAVYEPLWHYISPPPFLGIEPKTAQAAQWGLAYTYFHWTIHTYGIYISCGLCVAFAYYNCGQKFRFSAALHGILGDKVKGAAGHLVDGLAIFAIVGGIGTSLGFGVKQIGGGLNYLWGIPNDTSTWFVTIAILTVIYTLSSYSGIKKGISWLSKINVWVYFALMIFVFLAGPTGFILSNFISSLGTYINNLPLMSFYLDPFSDAPWSNSWSNFYWAWWLAFAPIVGLFLTRVAYGRTIRAFVTVNLIAPAGFGMVWFGLFGSAAVYQDHFQNGTIGEVMLGAGGIDVSLFALLENYPLSVLTGAVVILAVCISFITLADSMTSTVAGMTTKGYGENRLETEPPAFMKIFWGILMGILSWLLLVTGGAKALQTSSIVCGLPILVIQLLMAFSYIKTMVHLDTYDCVSGYTVQKNTLYSSEAKQ